MIQKRFQAPTLPLFASNCSRFESGVVIVVLKIALFVAVYLNYWGLFPITPSET
jgi:hypothetical protein